MSDTSKTDFRNATRIVSVRKLYRRLAISKSTRYHCTMQKLRVTVWGENAHEKKNKLVSDLYPSGMHGCIADSLRQDFDVRTATLDQPEHGLTKEVLESTDVLTWWGHMAHGQVQDVVVERVH